MGQKFQNLPLRFIELLNIAIQDHFSSFFSFLFFLKDDSTLSIYSSMYFTFTSSHPRSRLQLVKEGNDFYTFFEPSFISFCNFIICQNEWMIKVRSKLRRRQSSTILGEFSSLLSKETLKWERETHRVGIPPSSMKNKWNKIRNEEELQQCIVEYMSFNKNKYIQTCIKLLSMEWVC